MGFLYHVHLLISKNTGQNYFPPVGSYVFSTHQGMFCPTVGAELIRGVDLEDTSPFVRDKNVTECVDHQDRSRDTSEPGSSPSPYGWGAVSCQVLSGPLGVPLSVCSLWGLSWTSEGRKHIKQTLS